MTTTAHNPAALGPAPAAYSQGVAVSGAPVTLHVSGQVGVDAQGVAAPDFATQCRQTWHNLGEVLRAAGMDYTHIVKITSYLVQGQDYATFAQVRAEVLKGHKPASTAVYVAGLVKPEWLIEIEAVAVK